MMQLLVESMRWLDLLDVLCVEIAKDFNISVNNSLIMLELYPPLLLKCKSIGCCDDILDLKRSDS
jgi:hypothetical protein